VLGVPPARGRRSPATRAEALFSCLVTLLALLLTGGASPALAADDPAGAQLGAAAAQGAAAEANRVLADAAERACEAIARVAATVVLPSAGATPTPTVLGHGRWSWNGWVSGASGPEAADGSFGSWRGKPIGLVGTWSDTSEQLQTEMSGADGFAGFSGQMDIAVGALVRGETWEQAAAGQFVQRWTTAIRNLRAKRAGKGTTYIRIAHEMNGDWMAWGVNASTLPAYLKGYRLYASIVRKEFPQARLVFSPNSGNHTNVTIEQLWPGDDVVDVIGPDLYDAYPSITSQKAWDAEVNAWSTPGSPHGLGAWQQFAARHGRPIALPEWALRADDDPLFIRGVHDLMARYPAVSGSSSNAGRFVYDCYYNAESTEKLLGGQHTKANAMYLSLKWGS
jgi:hypothetical protein